MGERFTIVFEGDIRKFDGNPLKTETPFGVPLTVAIGDLIEQLNELEDRVHAQCTQGPSREQLKTDWSRQIQSVTGDRETAECIVNLAELNGLFDAALRAPEAADAGAVEATREQVEIAWSAIVGDDIASICTNTTIIRDDLRDAITAVLRASPSNAGMRERANLVTANIAHEFYRILERCGAKSDLLSIVGSYGDTVPDKDVLDWLRTWNEEGGSIAEPGRDALEKIAGQLFVLDLEQDDMDVGADARTFLGEVRSIARGALRTLSSTDGNTGDQRS